MIRAKKLFNNTVVVLGIDVVTIIVSLYAANLIRFEFNIPRNFLDLIHDALPFILFLKLVIFYFFDLYKGMWRYTSLSDLINILKAATLSSLVIIAMILFVTRFEGYSRSVFIIDWFLTIFMVAGFRLMVRFYFERVSSGQGFVKTFQKIGQTLFAGKKERIRLLIIGAGDCGETIFREIRSNAGLGYAVVGFLDDHPTKQGKTIHGVPVLGPISNMSSIAKRMKADEALIAIPSAKAEQMRAIVDVCRMSGVRFKTIPGYGELINGRVSISTIREVAYRDLLRREVVRLDQKKIGAYLKDQVVLVTGAGGSIGSELCRQICRYHPREILLYERAESPLYEIELELRKSHPSVQIIPVLADVQDRKQLDRIFETHRPQTVFHAAAYKHVPMLELHPWKAIENNIAGTLNVVDVVEKFDIERFVLVSTDKAVRPTNIMGTSKRVAEMLVQQRSRKKGIRTRFTVVRFGNVIGSVGSVIPLFKKQIASGGPVTVTHPEVTRYFMMIPEACQLILQAGAMDESQAGEIFLLDMGTPIKIADMARDLIRFSGFLPDEEIKIEYIGLRPGEKLYEELITADEGVLPTSHEKIMVLKGSELPFPDMNREMKELFLLAEKQDGDGIRRKLQEMVKEYTPSEIHWKQPFLQRM